MGSVSFAAERNGTKTLQRSDNQQLVENFDRFKQQTDSSLRSDDEADGEKKREKKQKKEDHLVLFSVIQIV